MRAERFNDKWFFSRLTSTFTAVAAGGEQEKPIEVTLPHDAMIFENPNPESRNGSNLGFYPGGNYVYEKSFFVPDEWLNRKIIFKFEGVYCNAFVYINGDFAANHPYGYSHFYVDAGDFLYYGKENVLRVTVKNGMEPNARWYSGSGIYRNVWMLTSDLLHIVPDGVKITTPEIDRDMAVAALQIKVRNESFIRRCVVVETAIFNSEGNQIAFCRSPLTAYAGQDYVLRQRIALTAPKLWNCEDPNLYTCRICLTENRDDKEKILLDEAIQNFGIRELKLDAVRGLRINGESVKLRGACIHHDNGILGAATFEDAEMRRCRQLKEAGFNCIRSSHNPLSEAMLDACDQLGMLVMDELCDTWHNPKSHYDYSMNFEEWWENDAEAMVQKDFNHPSVIIYSMGNEIPEAGRGKGAELNRRINEKLKSLDSTRYTTTALNSLFIVMDAIPQIIGDLMKQTEGTEDYQKRTVEQPDLKTDTEVQPEQSGDDDSGYAIIKGALADAVCSHDITSRRTEEVYAAMDIAGMNYMKGRFEKDHELYPDRVILSTENFPSDIAKSWNLILRCPHVIGDMTWTGYDYLGEAGIGIFYYDGSKYIDNHWPDRAAYVGDIDLIGNRRPLSYLKEIVYGLRKKPYIAVQKMEHSGKKGASAPWMLSDTIESWTWSGYEGEPVKVEVYSASEEVELLLNGNRIGKLPAGKVNEYRAIFETTYIAGELEAVGYTDGIEDGRARLSSAGKDVSLCVEADKTMLRANERDLSFLKLSLRDSAGNINMQEKRRIHVMVEGAGTLAGFGSANPQPFDSYAGFETDTFEGHALAVIRAGKEAGPVKVTFCTCDSEAIVELTVKKSI